MDSNVKGAKSFEGQIGTFENQCHLHAAEMGNKEMAAESLEDIGSTQKR